MNSFSYSRCKNTTIFKLSIKKRQNFTRLLEKMYTNLFIISLSAYGFDSKTWCIELRAGYQLIPADSLQSDGRFRIEFANEVDRLSVEREPGVICLFPMQSAEDSTKIRILEIYASEEAYADHLKTEHFQKYKQGTLHMVKSLKLPAMRPLDPETMKLIFKKQR